MKVSQTAYTLLKGISGQSVSSDEVEASGEYFSEGPNPISPLSFAHLFRTVIDNLEDYPAMRNLADKYQNQITNKQFNDANQADDFIRSYVTALDPSIFVSCGIAVGYAQQGSKSAYDTVGGRAHNIQNWVLLYTKEGSGEVDTGTRKHLMTHGCLVLFEPGATPSYYQEKSCDTWGYYWLVFQDVKRLQLWLDWPKESVHTSFIQVDQTKTRLIENAFDALMVCSSEISPAKQELENNILEQIILQGFNMIASPAKSGVDRRIVKAQRFVEKNYNKEFTIKDVALHIGLSEAGLARLFKQETGVTLLNWRDEKRMTVAIRLLESSLLSINEISAEIGVSDSNFFSTKFKKVFGCSPRKYRKDLTQQ